MKSESALRSAVATDRNYNERGRAASGNLVWHSACPSRAQRLVTAANQD